MYVLIEFRKFQYRFSMFFFVKGDIGVFFFFSSEFQGYVQNVFVEGCYFEFEGLRFLFGDLLYRYVLLDNYCYIIRYDIGNVGF